MPIGLGVSAGSSFDKHLMVLMLALALGYKAVWGVIPALHTPLMSCSNAISGVVLLSGMLQVKCVIKMRCIPYVLCCSGEIELEMPNLSFYKRVGFVLDRLAVTANQSHFCWGQSALVWRL